MIRDLAVSCDAALYRKALDTTGFFSEEEAGLLMHTVARASPTASMLEIGSFHGRSTIFALAALGAEQRWVVVDNFRVAAAYHGHSLWALHHHLADPRVLILPMTLAEAYRHLKALRFEVIFIDGDHSFLGIAQDLALSIALAAPGARMLCHDLSECFPGVELAVDALQRAGILSEVDRVGTVGLFEVQARPAWLVDPAVFRGEELGPA